MSLNVSELYGKRIVSNTGKWIGEVGEVVLDVEEGSVSHLLLGRIDSSKPRDVVRGLFKSGVEYKRVKKVSDTVVVSAT